MGHRVVVTGLGVISPIGCNIHDFWTNLVSGKSGIGRITQFDPSSHSSQIAGEVKDFDPTSYISPKQLRHMDKFVQYAVAASKQATTDSNLKLDKEDVNRIGVLLGSGIGSLHILEKEHKNLTEKGPSRVSPFLIPMLIVNMASGEVSISLGLKGPNTCVATACASGSHAIGDAFEILRRADADVMVTGGTESCVTPLGVAGFCSMKALSTRNDDPQRASRPFDKQRDGFIMAEGAGVVVLETLEHAQGRNAPIYAEVIGYGMSSDAYHVTAPDPDGDGAARAMEAALKDAEIPPKEVSYINAHGTSTPLNDKVETMAIKRVFGEYAKKIPVSSTKSMTGHTLGAAGGIEAVACILAIKEGIIPPTTNYQFPDPECDLDYVPNQARRVPVDVAMSNSLGFGGHNATLIFKKYRG